MKCRCRKRFELTSKCVRDEENGKCNVVLGASHVQVRKKTFDLCVTYKILAPGLSLFEEKTNQCLLDQ